MRHESLTASHSHPSTQVTALILAGGLSRRMGTDKALVSWQGRPLLQRVHEVARQCCDSVTVMTPWPERYQSLLPSTVGWIQETPNYPGPLVALAQGLEVINTPWVLLLACDMPQLNSAVIQTWIQILSDPGAGAIAYVPYYQSRWEPLCGFYHADCRSPLNAFIAAGGRSFQEWLSEIAAVPLHVDEAIAPMLRNCNTPSDLKQIR